MRRPLLAALYLRKRQVLRIAVSNKREEILHGQQMILDWEREIADLTAAIDAALDDGADLMADREFGDSEAPNV